MLFPELSTLNPVLLILILVFSMLKAESATLQAVVSILKLESATLPAEVSTLKVHLSTQKAVFSIKNYVIQAWKDNKKHWKLSFQH